MIYDDKKTICIDTSLPVFNLLGKRYTLFILGVIGNNNTRKNFNDIYNSIPGSNRTIIARRLKELAEAGIVKKYRKEVVAYELTEKGQNIRKGVICFLDSIDQII
jgi:DNA-binding HxlR family transcriptional regulator